MIKLIVYWYMIGGLWWLSAPMFGAAAIIAQDKGFDAAPALGMAAVASLICLFLSYISHSDASDEFEEEKRFYKRGIKEKIKKAKCEHEHMLRQQQDMINAERRRSAAAVAKEQGMITGAAKRKKRKKERGEMIYDPDTGEELGILDIDALNQSFFAEPGSQFYGPWRLDK